MYVVLNIQIDTILEYIIKFKVKQIMSKDDFIQEMIYKYVIRGSLNQWCRKKPISNKSSMAQWTKYNVLSEMGTSQYAWLNLKISKTRPYEHFRDTSVNLSEFSPGLYNFLTRVYKYLESYDICIVMFIFIRHYFNSIQ